MTDGLDDRCGYTWPEDHKKSDDPTQQNCCWRETVGGSDSCVWHADPDEVSKSIEALREARAPPEIRNQNSIVSELLDGVQLPSVDLRDTVSFEDVALRESDLSDIVLEDGDFSGASLGGADLSGASVRGTDFSGANLTGANLSDTDLSECNLPAYLDNANLSHSNLGSADLSQAFLRQADLSDVQAEFTNFTDATLRKADLSSGELIGSNFTSADLFQVDLSDTNLFNADLSSANLNGADLTNSFLGNANLTDAELAADLTEASLAGAKLVRANLHSANLTDSTFYGTTLTDVQINTKTMIRGKEQRSTESQWWQRGPFFPPQRCGYDPATSGEPDHIGRAADTYQTFEKIARENARPSLQSEMFVLRQDMQRKRHWQNGEYIQWAFARTSRTVFKHGESLARIGVWAVLIILAYTALYIQFGFIKEVNGDTVTSSVDALYFSTLTFTTLGLGDFRPEPTSEVARLLVTSQAALGAILIAVFVFVLGRRAAK